MFGGLIVLNQRRSDDGREPGPEQNFTRSLCEGALKHFLFLVFWYNRLIIKNN
jgi:hypothetical protein